MISIIIPIFNEEEIISEKYNELISELKNLNISNYEIIYGDDGSTDESKEIIEGLIKRNNKVKLISWFPNKGMGYNHRKLYNAVIGDIIIEFDADFSTKSNIIEKFLKEINNGYDVIIASRYVGGEQQIPLLRRVLSRIYHLFIEILFGIQIKDTQSGFVAFKKEIFDKVELESNGFDIHIELMYKIIKNGFKVKEIDGEYIHRDKGSKFNILSDGYKTILNTFKLYYKLVIKGNN